MGKILITERQLEILTEHVLFEQEIDRDDSDADMKKAGHKITSEPGEFKELDGGQPYELFMAKADTLSKAYFESGEYTAEESKALYFKYRRLNPVSINIKKWETKLKDSLKSHLRTQMEMLEPYFSGYRQIHPNDKEGYIQSYGEDWVNNKEKVQQIIIDGQKKNEHWQPEIKNNIKKLQEKLKGLLSKNRFDKEYQYSTEKGKKKEGWEKNPDYDPDGAKEDKMVSKAKNKVGDVTFSPTDRYVVMEKIGEYVGKQYDGNYEAATSDEVWERKGHKIFGGDGWVKRGIKSITLSPENIETKTIEQPQPVQTDICEVFELTPSDADGQLFENNLWGQTTFFEEQIDLLANTITTYKKAVMEKADGNEVDMYVSSKIYGGGGDKEIDLNTIIDYPYTIRSSCSQVPNGVNDKGEKLQGHGGTVPVTERISFEQLSKNRANTAKLLMYNKLTAIGIDMPEPIINWEGENSAIPGTSGPAWVEGGPVDSEALKKARFVKIEIAIGFKAKGDAPEPIPPIIFKVGDFKVQIVQDVDSWCGIFCKLLRLPPPKWPKWPRIKWPRWKIGGGSINTTACPKF